ncbi:Ig-like domain-containing protein [Lacticaseibacillus thailandensis]|uniref:Ig-like domain-containing protein n=1 Tax=Lacticaseibacillus thailandensis TaxID=381741 RepID=UPI0006D18103|nr:Ig-like domain-containing protein [Lacticaseibacillus thailandensis]
MKKHINGWRRLFTTVMSLLLIVGQLLMVAPTNVGAVDTARELPAQGLTADDATVKDQNGTVVQNPDQLTLWDNVYVQYKWSLADNVQVQSGDYVTVTLPDGVAFNQVQSFPIVDKQTGETVAHFTLPRVPQRAASPLTPFTKPTNTAKRVRWNSGRVAKRILAVPRRATRTTRAS